MRQERRRKRKEEENEARKKKKDERADSRKWRKKHDVTSHLISCLFILFIDIALHCLI